MRIDPDPAPLQRDGNLRPYGSIMSVHGLPGLHFGFNADPDPAFHFDADLDPASKTMRIRIRTLVKSNETFWHLRIPMYLDT